MYVVARSIAGSARCPVHAGHCCLPSPRRCFTACQGKGILEQHNAECVRGGWWRSRATLNLQMAAVRSGRSLICDRHSQTSKHPISTESVESVLACWHQALVMNVSRHGLSVCLSACLSVCLPLHHRRRARLALWRWRASASFATLRLAAATMAGSGRLFFTGC
jgi:hypothetical protein